MIRSHCLNPEQSLNQIYATQLHTSLQLSSNNYINFFSQHLVHIVQEWGNNLLIHSHPRFFMNPDALSLYLGSLRIYFLFRICVCWDFVCQVGIPRRLIVFKIRSGLIGTPIIYFSSWKWQLWLIATIYNYLWKCAHPSIPLGKIIDFLLSMQFNS